MKRWEMGREEEGDEGSENDMRNPRGSHLFLIMFLLQLTCGSMVFIIFQMKLPCKLYVNTKWDEDLVKLAM